MLTPDPAAQPVHRVRGRHGAHGVGHGRQHPGHLPRRPGRPGHGEPRERPHLCRGRRREPGQRAAAQRCARLCSCLVRLHALPLAWCRAQIGAHGCAQHLAWASGAGLLAQTPPACSATPVRTPGSCQQVHSSPAHLTPSTGKAVPPSLRLCTRLHWPRIDASTWGSSGAGAAANAQPAAGPGLINVPGNPANPVFYSNQTVLEEIEASPPPAPALNPRAPLHRLHAGQAAAVCGSCLWHLTARPRRWPAPLHWELTCCATCCRLTQCTSP